MAYTVWRTPWRYHARTSSRTSSRTWLSRPFRPFRLLRRRSPAGLQIADQRQDSQRHHLHTHHLSEANPSWKGYTAEQKSTLRALLSRHGIEPATGKSDSRGSAQGGRGDGEALAAGEIVIRHEAAYREQKKAFDRKYREYKQLDSELSSMTDTFEALEDRYSGAPTDQQNRAAMELIATYDEVRPLAQPPPLHRHRPAQPPPHTTSTAQTRARAGAPLPCCSVLPHPWFHELLRYVFEQKRQELEAKTRTYRLLHLELQSIKAAVKKFVDQRNNAH